MIASADKMESGCTLIEVSSFSYDAAENSHGKRRQPTNRLQSADAAMDKSKRKKTIASGRDLWRNFTLAGWAIRKHLDYTTQFTFQARTKDKEFNKELEKKVKKWSKRKKFDIARRHSLRRFLRIMECCATVDHDIGVVKLKKGPVQAIEADRIQTPPEIGKNEVWTQGVRTDRVGAALEYGVFNRGNKGRGYQFARKVPESNFWLHGNFDRFDQYRGISPLVTAINSMRDVYEGIDFGLAKLKVEQMFAFLIKRDGSKKPNELTTEEEQSDDGYDVSLDGRSIFLDMDPGDSAEAIKTDAPGSNTVPFLNAVIAIALKSLDIPLSFYDESFTNFFGSRAAWQHYERSCVDKRDRNIEFLDWWTVGQLFHEIVTNDLRLPDGLTLEDEFWEWVPDGMPWWDPIKEINGDNMAIKSGFTTPQKVVKKRGGGDFFDNIDAIEEAIKYASGKGVPLDWATFAPPVEVVEKD